MWWRFTFLALLCVVGSVMPGASAQAPAILVHPTNRVSFIGGSVIMSVTATGAPPLIYRWVKDGGPVVRGTNRLLNMINLSPANAGGYQAVVSNSFGVVTSRVASLTLTGAPPVIYLSPSNSVACATSGARLSVGVSGSPPFAYQWYFEGTPLANETSWLLSVPVSSLGEYFVTVTNDFGMATSKVARVTGGPGIFVQPENQTVNAGTGVAFSVVAQGCPEVRYQWRWNGLTVTNGTNSTLRYTYPTKDYEGNIDVVVWDDFGSETSHVARLTIAVAPPEIVSEPESVIDTWGASVSFHVGATGAPPPAYQWWRSGFRLLNETNAFLRQTLYPESQGRYFVVVNNDYGSVTSRVVSLSLPPTPPMIDEYGQPDDFLLCLNGFQTNNPAFWVNMKFPVPYASFNSFQWFKNGEAIPGATSSSLVLPRSTESFGSYAVVITNSLGSVTSRVAVVSGGAAFVHQSDSYQVVHPGEHLWIDMGVQSCLPVNYQWQKNGVNIPGATSTTLIFGPLSMDDSGDYRLVVQWASGAITSAVSRVEVVMREPWITDQEPQDAEVLAGDWVHFQVTEYDLGAPAGRFQWLFNGQPIPGANSRSLSFVVESRHRQGRYALTISNEFGWVTSRVATLKVFLYAPLIVFEPDDTSVPSGDYANFSVDAEAAPPPAYQWLRSGVPMRGETNEWLSVPVVGTNDFTGYSVIVSNQVGWVTSRVASVHVELFPPGFVQDLQDRHVRAGEWATFMAGVTSAPPASYQWYFEGAPLSGETNYYLQFVAGFLRQVGGYSVVASNPFGSVTSRVAQLEIDLIPSRIVLHPTPQNVLEGEPVVLWVSMSNNVPVEVRWQRDGEDVPGATNLTLRIRTSTTNDTGDYQAIVWNDQGFVTSRVAQVSIRPAGPLDRWAWRRPLPQGSDLNGVAFGNGRHVAVGDGGAVLVSSNGMDWRDARSIGRAIHRTSIAFGNGVFVALDDGMPAVSTDGVRWTDASFSNVTGQSFYGQRITFGNGRFVVLGADHYFLTSTNGRDWEAVSEPMLDFNVGYVSSANGRFIVPVTQVDEFGTPGILWSVDGLNWEVQPTPTIPVLGAVAFGEGRYIGFHPFDLGVFATSTNGLDWVEGELGIPLIFPVRNVVYGNGAFVFSATPYFGEGGLGVSTDGIDWRFIPGIGTNRFREVCFGGGRFVAVGDQGRLAASENGEDWSAIAPGSDLNFRGIAQADGMLVVVGNLGAIYTSPNGREWTARDSMTTNNLRNVIWFKDRFVAVGESAGTDEFSISVTSHDGIGWQTNVAPGDLYSLAHNGRRLVAVADRGAIVTSEDGVAWRQLPAFVDPLTGEGSPTTKDLNAITWTGERFVAVGKDGVVITSTNGLSWNSSGPGGGKNLHGVAHGNGVYVAVGNDGRCYVAPDASNWKRLDLPGNDLSDVAFLGGRFVTVGDTGSLLSSTDGTNWIRHVTVCYNDIRAILHTEGRYLAVGNNETILESAQADAALRISRLPAAGGVQVEVLGELGRAYRLQGSANLNTWTDLLNFTGSDEATRFPDSSNAGNGWRFYRAVSP